MHYRAGARQEVGRISGAFCTLALVFPIWYAYALFVPAIDQAEAWKRAEVAAPLALLLVANALAAPLTGHLIDGWGVRRVVHIGGLLLGSGVMLASQASAPVQMVLAYGIIGGIGISMSGWVPAVVAIRHGFGNRVSAQLGLASTGIGVGLLIAAPVIQASILALGWRRTMLAEGLVVLVGIQLAARLLPDTRVEHLEQRQRVFPLARPPIPFRSVNFWLLFGGFLTFSAAIQLVQAHQAAYLLGGGWDPFIVAAAVALVGAMSLPGKVSLGFLADRHRPQAVFTVGPVALIAALTLLIWVCAKPVNPVAVYAYALLAAIAYSMPAPIYPALAANEFGDEGYGVRYGFLTTGSGLGSALGVYGGGAVYDAVGSYLPALGLSAAASLVSATVVWLAATGRRRTPTECSIRAVHQGIGVGPR